MASRIWDKIRGFFNSLRSTDRFKDIEDESVKVTIKFHAKQRDKYIDIDHTFDAVPTKEELEEEFGPGLYAVYETPRGGKKKIVYRVNLPGNPTYFVDHYELKIRIKQGGKLFNTGATVSGSSFPSKERVISELGGGGLIKVNAMNSDDKVLWSEWIDAMDTPINTDLIEGGDDVMSAVKHFREDSEQQIINDVRDRLAGRVKQGDDGTQDIQGSFDRLAAMMEKSMEINKLEKLEELMARFDSFGKSKEKADTPESSDMGFADMMFKQPFLDKREAQRDLVKYMIKTNPTSAVEYIEKMPDGVAMVTQLGLGFADMMGGATEIMKANAKDARKRDKSKGKSKEKERPEVTPEDVGIDVKDEDGGFMMSFSSAGPAEELSTPAIETPQTPVTPSGVEEIRTPDIIEPDTTIDVLDKILPVPEEKKEEEDA